MKTETALAARTVVDPYTVPRYDSGVENLRTATDVIDHLTEHVGNMIVINNLNCGVLLTADQFDALFARTFDAALGKLLDAIDQANPQLGVRIRRQFVEEQDDRDFYAAA